MKKLLITAPLSFIPDLLEYKSKPVRYEYQPNKDDIKSLLYKFQPDAWIPKPCNDYLLIKNCFKYQRT